MFRKKRNNPDFSHITDPVKRKACEDIHKMYEENSNKYKEYINMQRRKNVREFAIVGCCFVLFQAMFIFIAWFMGVFDAMRESSGFTMQIRYIILSGLYIVSFFWFIKLIRKLGFIKEKEEDKIV